MGPRYLQSQIHTDYATGSNVWSEYRSQIKSMYDSSSNKEDFNDHLIREYNRKIERLNQQTGLYIAPFDGGFRFIGETISSLLPPTIAGLAYPNEALTAPSGSSYLWTVNGENRGINQIFVPTVNDIGEVVTCLVGGATTYTTTVWHPRDISSVQAFWWAAKNAYNFIGNNYTDANRPVVYNGSITLTLVSIGNYSGSSGENTYFIFKDGTYWVLEIYNIGGEEPSLQLTVYSSDDAQYPWQATWPSGTTITPTATTTDILATDGQTVPVWDDIISNQRATASSSNIALKEDTDLGGPSLKFDSTDFYALPPSARAIYNSKRWGYIFVGAKDSNPSGGDTNHGLVSINRTATATKIGLRTRDSSSNVFSARTNPTASFTSDRIVFSSYSNNSNYNVLTNESLWNIDKLALRINGVENNYINGSGGSMISNSGSSASYIGGTTSTTANFNGDITAVILASNIGESDEMSAVDRNRLERFVGLLGGIDIPLI